MLSDCGDVPVSALQGFADTVVPLVPPDTDRIVRFDNNELVRMDSRLAMFRCFPWRFLIRRFTVIPWTLGYRTVTQSGYAFCIPPARGVRGRIALQLDWTVRVWIIGEESSGTQVLWVNNAYTTCVMIVST